MKDTDKIGSSIGAWRWKVLWSRKHGVKYMTQMTRMTKKLRNSNHLSIIVVTVYVLYPGPVYSSVLLIRGSK